MDINQTKEKELQGYIDLFMEQFPELSSEAKAFTRSFLIIEKYKKKEFLYKNGEVQKEIGYLCKGLLRKFSSTRKEMK